MQLSRRSVLAGGLALAATGAVTACSSPVDPANQPSGTTSGSAGGGGGTSETLIIYSNSVSDGRGDWLVEQAKEAGFSLQFVDLGGGDVKNRLIAEKNNPIADVAFGLNNVFYENIKAEGVLEPYEPSWSGDVDKALGDKDGQFWPIVREPIMLVYSLEAYPDGKGAPQDWPDLWTKPEYHGKYETATGMGGATTRMVLSGILTRFTDPAGDLGISDAGWEAIGAFFKNGSPAVQGEDLFARMKAGKVNMGQMWLAGKSTREKQYELQTRAINPEIGVPMAVQHISLIKGTKKAETAKKFIDWFGGAEMQAKWSKQFFTAPTNEKALADASKEAVEATDAFKRQDIDWEFVAKNLDQWVEKIELNYLGA